MQSYAPASKVLLTDFRDAVVQRDPFALPATLEAWREGYTLLLSGEPPSMAIGVGRHITQWLTACFGEDFVKAHHASPNLCSGTTMGTAAAVAVNLRLMIELTLFKEADDEKHKDEFRKPGAAGMHDVHKREHCSTLQGVDQGFYNFLYYSGAYDKTPEVRAKVFPVGTGPMFTMGELATQLRAAWLEANPPDKASVAAGSRYHEQQYFVDAERPNLWLAPKNGFIELDADGFILLNDGTRAAVVHQLDRFGHRGYHPFMQLMRRGPVDANGKRKIPPKPKPKPKSPQASFHFSSDARVDGHLAPADPPRCKGCLEHSIQFCRFSATRNRCEGA